MGKHNETKISAVAVFLFVSGIAAYTEGVLMDARYFFMHYIKVQAKQEVTHRRNKHCQCLRYTQNVDD